MASRKEELQELAELEELEQLEAMEAQEQAPVQEQPAPQSGSQYAPGQTHRIDPETNRAVEIPEEERAPEESAPVDSVTAGLIEGVPFAKDAISAVQAISESVTNDTEETISEVYGKYKENLKDIDEDINAAESANPWAFAAGDIAGGFASLGASGLKGAVAIGALSGLSRSEQRTVSDMVIGGASGAVFHGLGVLGGKAVKKGINKFRGMAAGSTKEAVGALNKRSVGTINKHLNKTGQTAEEFSDSMLKQKVGEENLFKVGQEFEETLSKVQSVKAKVGEKIGVILDDLGDIKVSPKNVNSQLKRKIVDPLLQSDSTTKRELGKKISRMIDEDTLRISEIVEDSSKGTIIKKEFEEAWSVGRLHRLGKDIADEVFQTAKTTDPGVLTANSQKRKIVGMISGMVEEHVDSAASKLDPNLLGKFKRAKKDFGNLAVSEGILEKHLEGQGHGLMGNIKDLFSVRGLVVSGITSSLGVPPQVALAIGAGINRLTSSGSLGATMAIGLNKVSKAVVANPNGEIAKRLIRASGLTMNDFRKELGYSVAQLQLQSSPVQRTVEDVISNQKSLSVLLHGENADMGDKFDAVMEEGNPEEIAAFMDAASKHPKASKIIEEGVGWGGKVYTPEDKQQLEQSIRGSKLPYVEKLNHISEMKKTGAIPQLEEPVPYQKKWQKRDKQDFKY